MYIQSRMAVAVIALQNYLKHIEVLINENRLGEAIIHCRHILGKYPRHIDTYRMLGKAYLERGDMQDAIDVFQRILSADPEDFIAHIGLAIIYKADELMSQARWHMERAFEMDPYNNVIQDELKELYGRRDGLMPERLMLTRGALARLYVKGELYQQAVAEIRHILEIEGERVDLQTLLAEALWRADERIDAVEVCRMVLDTLPNCIKANAILAEVWLATGRTEEAQPYLRRLHEMVLLDKTHLNGQDDPAGQAFKSRGAMPIPDVVEIVQLDEEAVFAADLSGSTDWVQELGLIESQDDEGAELEDVPDWLQSVESTQDADESAAISSLLEMPDDNVYDGISADDYEGSDLPLEELPDWLADEDDDAMARFMSGEVSEEPEPSETQASSTELAEDAPDWFAELDVEAGSEVSSTDDTGNWLSKISFDDEMDEKRSDSLMDDALVDVGAIAAVEAVAGELAEPNDEDVPDWLAEMKEDEPVRLQVEDDGLPDWLGDLTSDEPETTSEEPDMPDWLADVSADEQSTHVDLTKEADNVPESTADDDIEGLPDWLTDDLGKAEGMTTGSLANDEWLDGPGNELGTVDNEVDWTSWLSQEDLPAEEPPAEPESKSAPPEDVPAWLGADVITNTDWLVKEGAAEPAENTEELPMSTLDEQNIDGGPDDEAEEFDDALSWLEDLAAQPESGDVTLPSTRGKKADAKAEDDLPDWLQGDFAEDEPAGADALDWLQEVDTDTQIAQPAEDIPDWLADTVNVVEKEEDADNDLSWLDDIAAGGGPAIDEPPTLAWQEEEPTPAEAEEESLDWLDDLSADSLAATIPAEPAAEESLDWLDDLSATPTKSEDAGGEELDWLDTIAMPADDIAEELGELVIARDGADDEVTDSANDSMDWLDELADEPTDLATLELEPEGDAPLDWLDSLEVPSEVNLEVPEAEEVAEEEPSEEDSLSLDWLEEAESPDWLDDVAVDNPAGDESANLDWLDDLSGGTEETVIAESLPDVEPVEESSPSLEEAPEDLDDAMAWLEQLAARQGASLDELPTVDEAPDEVSIMSLEPDDDIAGPDDITIVDQTISSLPDTIVDLPDIPVDAEAVELEPSAMVDTVEPVDAEPADVGAVDEFGDVPEDPDEAMAWLEQLAAKQGAPLDELPSVDEAPEIEPIAESEETILAAPVLQEMEPIDIESSEIVSEAEEVPEDLDDAMAWLEQLAARQGASLDELPTVDEAPELVESLDDESLVDEGVAEAILEVSAPEVVEEIESVAEQISPDEPEIDDVPEDLDDAMAWLEQLAAKQGAPLDELPTVDEAPEVSEVVAELSEEPDVLTTESVAEEPVATMVEVEEVPEDLDDAMAWLEQLAAKQGASIDELPTVDEAPTLVMESPVVADELASETDEEFFTDADEALAWLDELATSDLPVVESEPEPAEPEPVMVVEEPPTPAVAFDVADAIAEAEAIEPDPMPEESAPVDLVDEIPEDPDAAMAWLEQLAARQGAALDELPSVDSVEEDVAMPDWIAQEAEQAASEPEPEPVVEAALEPVLDELFADDPIDEVEMPDWMAEDLADTAIDDDLADFGELIDDGVAPAGDTLDDVDLNEGISESLPDWLSMELIGSPAELDFDWDDVDTDMGDWMEAEEEATTGVFQRPDLPSPTVPAYEPPPPVVREEETRPEPAPEPAPIRSTVFTTDNAQFTSARQALQSGNYESALGEYEGLLADESNVAGVIADLEAANVARRGQPKLRRLLGDAYMRNGQLQEALDLYRNALDLL